MQKQSSCPSPGDHESARKALSIYREVSRSIDGSVKGSLKQYVGMYHESVLRTKRQIIECLREDGLQYTVTASALMMSLLPMDLSSVWFIMTIETLSFFSPHQSSAVEAAQ